MACLEGLHHIKFFILRCAGLCIVPPMLLFHRDSITAKFYQSYDTKSVLCRESVTYICMQVCHIAARAGSLMILDFTAISLVLFTCFLKENDM